MPDESTALATVRGLVAAFNAEDDDAARALLDPDVEFSSILLGGTVYRGHEGMATYRQDLREIFEDWHSEDDRFLELPDGGVLWLYRIVGLGRGSGVPVDHAMGVVWSLRDGLLIRGTAYPDQHQALAAAGLDALPGTAAA